MFGFITDNGRPILNAKIFIGTPFCNEDHAIDKYMESLKNIDYPKNLIDILWIENNSSDNTWKMLNKYYEEFKNYGYNSVKLISKCGNYKDIQKSKSHEISAGKIGNINEKSYIMKTIITTHLAKLFNLIMDKSIEFKCDYCLTLCADIMIPSNTIQKFLQDFELIPDCGWIGGVGHKRYPIHKRNLNENSNNRGLGCPVMKILDREPTPKGYEESWMNRRKKYRLLYRIKQFSDFYPYPYGFYTITDEDLFERQKFGDGIFECCLVGHVWMIPDYIIKKGLRVNIALVESALDCELQLSKMGYKMYCDSHIYMKHISIDGNIWVDMVDGKFIYYNFDTSPNKIIVEKEKIKERAKPIIIPVIGLNQIIKESIIPNIDNVSLENYLKLKELFTKRFCTIPNRPPVGGSIRDPISGKTLIQKDWDKIYGKFKKYIEGGV